MPKISSVREFLAHVGLDHLSGVLGDANLEELGELAAETKTKCINRLKELGVEKLPERQKFANGMLKALREGLVEDTYTAKKEAAEAKAAEEAKANEGKMSRVTQNAEGQKVQTEDDGFDLAVAILQGVKKEDPNKPVHFATYDDQITATALVDSLAENFAAKMAELKTFGSSTKPPPSEATAVLVGAGMGGLQCSAELIETGGVKAKDIVILEKAAAAGGVWFNQANSYSRVNSSEPSYRLPRKSFDRKECYTNHTPAHIIADSMIQTLRNFELVERLHTRCTVESVTARTDGTKGWVVEGTQDETAAGFSVKSELAVLCTNRRLGAPRQLSYHGEADFKGVVARGLNSDAEALDWKTRTVIIGMGAFALEHMRTALERGAPYCSILARRRGAVCPQVIDWVNFVRPVEHDFMKDDQGSTVVQVAWHDTYTASGAKIPDCWKERPPSLKPDGHTVSTSDLFFVAHHLGMAISFVGEVDHLTPDAIMTKDWGELPSTLMPCGIVIKCVGFLTNAANERILQRTHFRASGLVDDQLWCVIEAHLDAGTFSLPFGSSYLNGVQFSAKVIANAWADKGVMTKILTIPINATLTKFTASEQFDSLVAMQKLVPQLTDTLHEQVVQVRERCNAALSFKEYLDRNEVMWGEYHEMLFPRSPLFNVRNAKGLLPWKFRHFEQMVANEWNAYEKRAKAREAAKARGEVQTAVATNYAARGAGAINAVIDKAVPVS